MFPQLGIMLLQLCIVAADAAYPCDVVFNEPGSSGVAACACGVMLGVGDRGGDIRRQDIAWLVPAGHARVARREILSQRVQISSSTAFRAAVSGQAG